MQTRVCTQFCKHSEVQRKWKDDNSLTISGSISWWWSKHACSMDNAFMLNVSQDCSSPASERFVPVCAESVQDSNDLAAVELGCSWLYTLIISFPSALKDFTSNRLGRNVLNLCTIGQRSTRKTASALHTAHNVQAEEEHPMSVCCIIIHCALHALGIKKETSRISDGSLDLKLNCWYDDVVQAPPQKSTVNVTTALSSQTSSDPLWVDSIYWSQWCSSHIHMLLKWVLVRLLCPARWWRFVAGFSVHIGQFDKVL